MTAVQNPNTAFQDAPVFEGMSLTLGGNAIIIPKLGVGTLKKFKHYLANLPKQGEIKSREQMLDIMIEAIPIVTAALKRNYPHVTEDLVGDLMDVTVFQKIFTFVTTPAQEAKEAVQGEAEASPSTK